MGYDSRIYIVEKSRYAAPMNVVIDGEDYGERIWGQVIASMELGVYPTVSNLMCAKPETDMYIYGSDGSTMIVEDCYGKVMTECSIEELLEEVQKDIDRGEDYRRVFPLYGLLKGFNTKQWDNLRVLHYGH